MSLAIRSAIVGGMTLLSRIFGFVRDVLIAYMLGASGVTDAFFVAFKLPNFMRRIFAEGAFNAAFLPSFAGMLREQGQELAMGFANHVYSLLAIVLCIVVGAGIAGAPYVVQVFAPGYADTPELLALTTELTRITFPYLLCISLVCLLGGVLNSVGKFAAVAAAPIWLNLVMIAALLLLTPMVETPAHALAWGVLLSGIVQYVWLLLAASRCGVRPAFVRPQLSPEVRAFLRLMAPATVGASVTQINLLVDVMLASMIPGAVSFLYYADRLYELPLGVIGIAVSTALLPMLASHIRAGEWHDAQQGLNNAIKLVMLLGLPSAMALVVVADPLVRGLFEYGAFDVEDRMAVVPAVMVYGAGLPAFLLSKILVSGSFAARDTKTPVKIGVLCIVINASANLILMQYYAHVGLAMGTVLSAYVNTLLLALHGRRVGYFKPDYALWWWLLRLSVACAGMGGLCMLVAHYLTGVMDGSVTGNAIGLVLLIGIGGVAFAMLAVVLRVASVRDVVSLMRRRRKHG